jgi:tetratricopeptide (TPR) repeat protein
MISLELELFEFGSRNDVYELRNFLKEEMPDVDFSIKEHSPLPGQMGEGLASAVVAGFMHAGSAILLESLYHNLLKPLLQKWIEKKQATNSRLEIMSSLSNGEEKVNIMMNAKGNTELFNFKYAIDTAKTYALLIGVGKFTSHFHSIPPIKGNVEDFFKLLISKKHVGIPAENMFVSYDETHVEIQKKLLQISSIKDAQTILIYFAGHGYKSDVKSLSLIAADTEKIGDEIIGGIDFDFIKNKILKNSIARQKIVILDACHSGIATQGDGDLIENFDVKGSYILTSSPGDEVSYFEKNAQNTYFTGALLNVLKLGVDNTSEMLALEDLYGNTKEILLEKNMPSPNSKSELNIPASQFFIARNPLFSAEKLKLRASNLFRDGKLDEALDEYRFLLKRFPDDISLRKLFEECETEKSFSNLVHKANTCFYTNKDYAKAADLYRKALLIKKDATLIEKIRQCELSTAPSDENSTVFEKLKENQNYQAYKKAIGRNAYFSAQQYVRKLQTAFPDSSYVKDELLSIDTKLAGMADSRKNPQLQEYYQYYDKGDLGRAEVELKKLIQNDPDYPVFSHLQTTLQLKFKTKEEEQAKKKSATLYRLFQLLPLGWKLLILLIPAVTIAVFITLFIREKQSKTTHNNSEIAVVDSNKTKLPVINTTGANDTIGIRQKALQKQKDSVLKITRQSDVLPLKNPPQTNEQAEQFFSNKSNSIAAILNGTTYEEPTSTNSLSFSYVTKTKIHYNGLFADYPVSGDFIIAGDKSLRTKAGDLDGELMLSDDIKSLTGQLKLKTRNITKTVLLVNKFRTGKLGI